MDHSTAKVERATSSSVFGKNNNNRTNKSNKLFLGGSLHERFLCPNCSAKLQDEATFKSHVEKCLESSECSVVFPTKNDLKVHLSQEHGKCMPFSCHLCGKEYQSAMGLTYHMRAHEGRFYQCSVCDAKLTQKSSMRRHLIKVHGVAQCNVCSGIFQLGLEYNQHVLYCV